jgi:hypothetical protein
MTSIRDGNQSLWEPHRNRRSPMSEDKKPPLSFEDVQEILRILEKSTFNELHLNIGGLDLRLRRLANTRGG